MKNLYKGLLIEESIIDNRILNDFRVQKIHITDDDNPEERWHIYSVLLTRWEVLALASQVKLGKWYAHFWLGDTIIVVFSEKIFEMSISDKSSWREMLIYAKSL